MNKEYLNELLVIRKQEIKDGKNAATNQPIYVVLDLQEKCAFTHDEINSDTNRRGKEPVQGWIDSEHDGEPDFITDELEAVEMKNAIEVTTFWIDSIAAFFITRQGAESYLKYQKHNLTEPYIYTFSTGYANYEMNKLLNNQ